MGIINTAFRTVKCDGPECTKEVTFEASQGMPPEILETNPWLKTNRAIQTADNRLFSYCSDVCEIDGIKSGRHNAIEPKTVQPAQGGAAAIAMAAAEARRKQLADENIRAGKPATVSLS